MKKNTILTGCILLVSSCAFAADLPDETGTELQSRENATVQFQAQAALEGVPALLQAMQRHQFRHQNTLRIRNMIQDAQKKGFPVTPIRDKVYEGIAKKVPEDAIVRAASRVTSRYENAYRQANELTPDKQQANQLGQIIAGAYTAGMKEEDCAQIMTQLQTRTRTTNQQESNELMVQTMATARIMARRGVESETISDVLDNALQHSYQAHEMHTLQNSFVEKAIYGSPEDIARGFSADISQGSTASELGAQSSDKQTGSGSDGSSSSSESSGASSSSGSSGASGSSGSSGASGSSGSSGASGSSGSSGASGSSGSSGAASN